MGTYATTTSFSTLMIGVSLDSNTTSLISKCITWAESEIDRRLAKRYDVSSFQVAVPPRLTAICEQLTLGFFYENNSRGGKDGRDRGKSLYERVKAELDDLAAGKGELVSSAGSVIAARSGMGVLTNTEDYTSTFGEDDPLNWVVDSDKLDDISDTRD